MTLAIVLIVVLLVIAFLAAGGAFDRVRTRRTRRVIVDRPVVRERVVERPVATERVVERDRVIED
jgi:hypothetical protein